MKYDPMVSPVASKWLELDEGERISVIAIYHKDAKIKLPNETVHACMHAVVENQLAEKLPVTVRALERLIAEGLDRHNAVHAIGCVVSSHIFTMMKESKQFDMAQFERDLSRLTRESWLAEYSDEDGEEIPET